MSTTAEVTQKDLHDLLNIFEKKSFDAASCEEGTLEYEITKKCECLFKQDYTLIELDNTNGVLSPRYPSRIFIPEYEHGHMASTLTASNINTAATSNTINNIFLHNPSSNTTLTANSNNIGPFIKYSNSSVQQNHMQQTSNTNVPPTMTTTATNTIYEDLYDFAKIRELITMAKYARCRQRFVVPVIMYRGKYICRSATISINAETYGRKVVDYAYDCLNGTNYSDRGSHTVDDENNDNDNQDSLMNNALNEPSPFSYEEVIKSDIQLLNALNVTTIVDLMVEMKKIKYFMAVSSSEKADPDNHYEDFNIISLPYPGCEFFKSFRDHNYQAKDLHYNWEQSFNDAYISVPNLSFLRELNINWNEYKNWDLVLITQNYLKACLRYIQEENSGLLIHCISGWDRTPLFISMLRLSLWADGLIHHSLNAQQMAYFTLAYDWFLFGHQLPDRLKRGEDIMFFCFKVLKCISDEEFRIVEHRKRTKTSSSSGSSVIVLNKSDSCDDDSLKEDPILGYDLDSNDSFSNSSICDMSITDNFFSTATATTTSTAPHGSSSNIVANNPITNRSPNAKRSKTSPISVPGASARQRHESTSSNGSWQVVTDTGSIDSMVNSSYISRFMSQKQDASSQTSCNSGTCNGGCNCSNTPYNSENSTNNPNYAMNNMNAKEPNPTTTLRKQRIRAVRSVFSQAYGQTVGLKFKEGKLLSN